MLLISLQNDMSFGNQYRKKKNVNGRWKSILFILLRVRSNPPVVMTFSINMAFVRRQIKTLLFNGRCSFLNVRKIILA